MHLRLAEVRTLDEAASAGITPRPLTRRLMAAAAERVGRPSPSGA